MKDGLYMAKVDSSARRVESVYIDQEALELEALNARTRHRRESARQEQAKERLDILEKRRKLEQAQVRQDRMARKKLRSVILCAFVAAAAAACAAAGLMHWCVSGPIMILCAVLAGWKMGRGTARSGGRA